mmetsp:Transcript_37150/g.42758  ORF Transcript_37150/g.42758 Transcript_37150/m.42758 type:complete len:999 (-) Transcript_37150:1211-4207(-)
MSTKGGHKSSSSRTEIKTLTNSNGAKPSAPAPVNAWARPLQSKRTTAPPPGIDLTKSSTASPSSSSSASPPSSSLSSSSSSVLVHRERLLHLSLTIVGKSVIVHQTNGAIIEGIFHTFTPFSSLPIDQRNKYVLKEIIVRRQATNGADLIKNGVTLIVPASKVSCLHAKDVATNLTNNDNNSTINQNNMNGGMIGSSSMLTSLGAVAALSQSQGTGSDGGDTFVTDTQISSSSRGGKNQDLVAAGNAWTAGGSSSNSNSNSNSIGNSSYKNQAIGNSSGGSGGPPFQATNSRAAALAGNSKSSPGGGSAVAMSGSIGQWDQFKANKELFNVDATFDENIYTTQLDTSQLDAKKVAEAERIANEIKTMTTSNIHVAEERGFKVETDFDEEDLYSGVLTTNGKQRHEESVPKKTKETEKSSSVSNQQGPNINSLKQNISATSTAPTKIMNYAAAAAKADTSSSNNKTAPPGFLGNNHDGESSSSAPTNTITISVTDDNGDKEENNKAESQTVAVMPEKKTKVDVKSTVNKSTKKAESNSSKDDTTKNDIKGKTAGKNIRSEKAVPSTNDNNKLSKDEPSISALSTRNEKVKKSGDSEKDKGKEKKKEKKDDSKLNANAKSFTFNPSAKSFTPSLGGGGGANNSSAPQQPPQHASTTDSSMQMYGGVHPMQPPHYMQTGPIGQPGMVPMINPQYQGMRYPPASYGIEQTMPQMQHQPPHTQAAPSVPSDPSSGNAPTPTPGSGLSIGNEDDSTRTSRDGNDTSQKQGGGQQQPPQRSQQQQLDQPQGPPHQQQTQQQQIPIPYNVPPGAYFTAGGIPGMPPRGPGYAQFVTGPQQIAGRPGAPPYGIYPMQPGGMPPNMQMRGPNGVPFYPGPNGPIPYPPGAHMGFPMMDDGGQADFRNRGARSSSSSSSNNGRGRGRTRSNSGRGRSNNNNNSNYNNNNNHNSSGTSSGKNTQQQYNNYQPPQQQQQHQPPQQQGQSATHAHSSKSNNPSPSNKADDRE